MKTITEIINDAWLAGYKEGYKTDYQKPEKAKMNMANNYTTEVVNKNDLLPDVSFSEERAEVCDHEWVHIHTKTLDGLQCVKCGDYNFSKQT